MTTNNNIRETLELFRKQCVNKKDGVGFEETAYRLEALQNKARIDELERIMNGQITIRSFITGDGGEEQIVTYEFANNEIKDRIKELKDNL